MMRHVNNRTRDPAAVLAALLVGLALAACAPAEATPAATDAPAATTLPDPTASEPTGDEVAAPTDAPTGAPTDAADEATEAPAETAAEETIPGRPDAPADVNAGFRSDPASVIGATGRPQLLEFFTYW